MTEPLLNIRHLSIAFKQSAGEQLVIENLDLTLNRGEILALVGESGSGKSVTAQAILRLLPQYSAIYRQGVVELEGQNLLALSEKQLSRIRGVRIGMIFQEPMSSLNPLHTIHKQLAESLLLHQGVRGPEATTTVISWLERVGIRNPVERLNVLPHELSGGERQRVMIAMALINEPDILIADEPTTALDVTIQAQILDLLRSLQASMNMAILFITHDLGIVRRLANRVAVMQIGKILETGPTEQIFASPQHEYTRQLFAANPGEPPIPYKTDTAAILQVQDLSTRFTFKSGLFKRARHQVTAVDNVHITLRLGETLGVVGESGSGKTTLGRTLLKLIPADTGSVHYRPEAAAEPYEILSMSAKAFKPLRQQIQMIFQDPFSSLSPRMSALQIVSEGLRVYARLSAQEIEDQVVEALQAVRLDPQMRHRYPNEFSGGQRQRLAIARALILKPRVLILDEPTSALDRTVQKDILTLLKQLQQDYQLAYIFISHDLSVVRAMSHQILVLQAGKVVEQGDSETLFRHPANKYTRELLAAALLSDVDKKR